MNDRLELVTAPNAEPVLRDDVKNWLRITGTDEDDFLDEVIKNIRYKVETFTGISIIDQEWKYWLDDFPKNKQDKWWNGTRQIAITELVHDEEVIELPRPPLKTITHIKYYDADGTENTFAASKYFVDSASIPGRVVLNEGEVWPHVGRNANGVEIQFESGYGDTHVDVPGDLKLKIMKIIAWEYENRGDMELPFSKIEEILIDYKVHIL